MGLFGENDDENETREVDPPESSQTHDGDASEQERTPEEDLSQEEESDASDDDLEVEEALKELSARMAVLSSNLEGVQESRGELEDKLGNVEERMSRLGSLAEAVSSEYNPFISENAPDQPSWTPDMEDREDPGEIPGSPASSDDPEKDGSNPGPEPPDLEDVDRSSQIEPDVEQGPPEQESAGESSLDGDGGLEERIPTIEPERLEPTPSEDDQEPKTAENPFDGHNEELEENLLLLEWVGMMLDRVGRAGLMDLLDYYQNLGWLDRRTKDQATRVAVGVDAPDRVDQDHWRGDVELHRRSLVAIQRLQGNEVPAARIDQMKLDLQRIFKE